MTSGFTGDRPRDAQPLLLTAGQGRTGLVEPVLDLVPEVRADQGPLDGLVQLLLVAVAVELQPGRDVVVDGHRRERVGTLEHHADEAADRDRIDARSVQVDAVQLDLSGRVGAGNDLVHAVQRSQHRRLAAAGRADECRDGTGLDHQRDAGDGLEGPVVGVEVLDLDAFGHVIGP